MKIALVFEIVRPLEDHDAVPDGKGGTVEVNNFRRNKFWAVPVGATGPEILVCIDKLEPEKKAYLEALALVVEKSYFVFV